MALKPSYVPAIPGPMGTGFYLFILFTNTTNISQSAYYNGDCLKVEESQGSSWPYDWEILCETISTWKLTANHSYIPADMGR